MISNYAAEGFLAGKQLKLTYLPQLPAFVAAVFLDMYLERYLKPIERTAQQTRRFISSSGWL